MSKTKVHSKLLTAISCLCACLLLSSCRYEPTEEECVDIVSGIAEIAHGNYTNDGSGSPLSISMTDIERITDHGSDLYGSINRYDVVKDYNVYLVDDHMVIVFTDSIFQQRNGYVVSDEELQGTLTIPGLGVDGDRLTILNRIENSNIYSFSAGQ